MKNFGACVEKGFNGGISEVKNFMGVPICKWEQILGI